MVYLLPNLNHRIPGVLGFNLATVRALLTTNDHFKHVRLLEDGVGKDFLLHGQLDLDPFAVRFSPQKTGINKSNFVQALDTFQAERHQLFGFQAAREPLGRRLLVTFTATAKIDDNLFAALLRDVNTAADTVEAHVG